MAEAEAAWWNAEVVEPAMAAGRSADEIGNPEFADRSTPLAERAMLGLYVHDITPALRPAFERFQVAAEACTRDRNARAASASKYGRRSI